MAKKNTTYGQFIEKFKSKKTTDDCYTPPLVYDAVCSWARRYLDIGDRPVVRPFWPGGDYEQFDYPEDCVVIDNPPFSIFVKIVNFYVARGIRFLLFAPSLTSIRPNCTYIGNGTAIIYENGAVVNTSFVTNMLGDLICTTAPELHKMLYEADKLTQKQGKKQRERLEYPDCVLRASTLHTFSHCGITFQVSSCGGAVVSKACNNSAKGEFGKSIVLSDTATAQKLAAQKLAARKLAAQKLAAQKLAAQKLAAQKLALSPNSKEIISRLNAQNT